MKRLFDLIARACAGLVLLGGGSKKRQQKDIDQAVVLWEDYKRRKAQILKGM